MCGANTGNKPREERHMKFSRTLGAFSIVTMLIAGSVTAQTPLKDVAYVRDGIITVGMAFELSEKCDSLNARFFRGVAFLNDLKSHARGLGYSDAEIDAYTSDKTEKRRLEAIARDMLGELGVTADDPQSYCTVGRAQIAAGTPVGRLLR
jgi:hypothetical protein